MTDSERSLDRSLDRRLSALFVAAHAVADTQLGLPFDRVSVLEVPGWAEPDWPPSWSTEQQRDELLLQLSVGYAVLVRGQVAAEEAARVAQRDLRAIAEMLKVDGHDPDDAPQRALERATPFFEDEANAKAVDRIAQELQTLGWLDMHEVDLLVQTAQGDPEAPEDLQRYRAAFSADRIPWPDHT